jgi:hypothetical protein
MTALKLTAVALLLSTAACAGRSPAPVLMTQAQDNTSSCAAMRAEIATNNEKRADLRGEYAGKYVQNVVATAVGVFIWPVLFALDVQDAAGKESKALEERNLYLAKLADERCQHETETAALTSQPSQQPIVKTDLQ